MKEKGTELAKPQTIRSRAAIQRENEKLRSEVAAKARAVVKARAAAKEEASAAAVAKAHWPQWAVAVLSAVISLAVAGIGGLIAVNGAQFGADEDRQRESREKKVNIYADYLAAARTTRAAEEERQRAFIAWGRADEAQSTPVATNEQARAVYDAAVRLGEAGKKATAAIQEFDKQADLLYVYGSDEAWQAHLRVQLSLAQKTDEPNSDAVNHRRVNEQIAALQGFQAVFCREASATPRQGCASDKTIQIGVK